MKKVVLALSLIAAGATALAQGTGFYVGGSIGQSNTRFKSDDFSANSPSVSESKDRHDTAWKLFAGYNFNQYLAVEAGYTDFGKAKYEYQGNGALAGFQGETKAEQDAWFAVAKGTFPIDAQFNVFGKLGVTRNHLKVSGSTNIPGFTDLGSESENRSDALIGVGAEFLPAKNFGIRVEYENYGRFGDQDNTGRTRVDLWSVGAVFNF